MDCGKTGKEIDVAILDVETTGFMPHDRIVEIAIIKIDKDYKIQTSYQTLLNPKRDVGPTKIHGITASMVKEAPQFRDIADTLTRLLTKKTLIIGHNVSFDLRFIEGELRSALHRDFSFNSFDTLKTARKHMNLPSYKLDALCSHLNITNQLQHSAMGDTEATLQLFKHLNQLITEQTGVNFLESYKAYSSPKLDTSHTVIRSDFTDIEPKEIIIRDIMEDFKSPYSGKRICLTGSFNAANRQGMLLRRNSIIEILGMGGASYSASVTKSTDFLVAADSASQSCKARTARKYGIPIIDEKQFWEECELIENN